MEGAGSRRQDTFGLREIGLNLSTETGDAASMMYTADASVDTVMAPIGVATQRDAAGADIGRRVAASKKKVTRYFPGKAPKWVRSGSPDAADVFSGGKARDRRDRGGDRGSRRGGRAVAEAVVLKRDFKDEGRAPAKAFEEDGEAARPRPAARERRPERVKAAPVVLKAASTAASTAAPAAAPPSSDS